MPTRSLSRGEIELFSEATKILSQPPTNGQQHLQQHQASFNSLGARPQSHEFRPPNPFHFGLQTPIPLLYNQHQQQSSHFPLRPSQALLTNAQMCPAPPLPLYSVSSTNRSSLLLPPPQPQSSLLSKAPRPGLIQRAPLPPYTGNSTPAHSSFTTDPVMHTRHQQQGVRPSGQASMAQGRLQPVAAASIPVTSTQSFHDEKSFSRRQSPRLMERRAIATEAISWPVKAYKFGESCNSTQDIVSKPEFTFSKPVPSRDRSELHPRNADMAKLKSTNEPEPPPMDPHTAAILQELTGNPIKHINDDVVNFLITDETCMDIPSSLKSIIDFSVTSSMSAYEVLKLRQTNKKAVARITLQSLKPVEGRPMIHVFVDWSNIFHEWKPHSRFSA